MQGYYLGGSGQPLVQTSGIAVNTTQFVDGLGLFSVNVEGYGGDGFRTGNLFVGLQGMPSFGWHWDFMGGDFHLLSNLVENPFSNVYTPEIAARGVRIAMRRTNRTYQFFAGEDAVSEGPRIPFRLILPQRVMGATMQQKVGERWSFGVRYLNMETSPTALTQYPTYFSPGRDLPRFQQPDVSIDLRLYRAFQVLWRSGLRRTVSTFTPSTVSATAVFSSLLAPRGRPKSSPSAPITCARALRTCRCSVTSRATAKARTWKGTTARSAGWISTAPLARYSNNLENNPDVPSFHSSGYSAGSSVYAALEV